MPSVKEYKKNLMKKVILTFLLIVSIILPVVAEEISISDIKVQGLKRVDPGLVFDNIPFEIDTPLMKLTSVKLFSFYIKLGNLKI